MKMNKKRESFEIVYDILKALQEKGGRLKPTHILYKSNLSHQMLTEYLAELIKKNLVFEENNKGKKMYSLTAKGYSFLKDFYVIRKFIESYGLE